MPIFARILVLLVVLPMLAFCIVGFLATFEPPGATNWRWGYFIGGTCSVAVGAWALLARRAPR